MSVDFDDIVKEGLVKVKGKRLKIWKAKWLILRTASSKGPVRLEKCDEDAERSNEEVRGLKLSGVTAVSSPVLSANRYVIEIMFNDRKPFIFSTEQGDDAESWYSEISNYCSAPSTPPITDVFNVYLMPTPNLTVHGECILHVLATKISIYDVHDSTRLLVEWKLNALRKYGRDPTKFTIESGRLCSTGEGVFIFNTYQSEQIYEAVHKQSRIIADTCRLDHRNMPSTLPPDFRRSFDVHPSQSSGGITRSTTFPRQTSTPTDGGGRRPLPPVPSR